MLSQHVMVAAPRSPHLVNEDFSLYVRTAKPDSIKAFIKITYDYIRPSILSGSCTLFLNSFRLLYVFLKMCLLGWVMPVKCFPHIILPIYTGIMLRHLQNMLTVLKLLQSQFSCLLWVTLGHYLSEPSAVHCSSLFLVHSVCGGETQLLT